MPALDEELLTRAMDALRKMGLQLPETQNLPPEQRAIVDREIVEPQQARERAALPPWQRKLRDLMGGAVDTGLGILGVGPDTQANRFGQMMGAAVPAIAGLKGLKGALGLGRTATSAARTGRAAEDLLKVMAEGKSPYAIISAAKSGMTPEEIAARMKVLQQEAERLGGQVSPQMGQFGGPEPSLVIRGIEPRTAEALGDQFGQMSVITHQGYHRLGDRQVFPSKGLREVGPDVTDYYSELPDGRRYQMDFPEEAYADVPDRLLDLEHRSVAAELAQPGAKIDPAMFGRGMAGEEKQRAGMPDWLDMSFFTRKGGKVEARFRTMPTHMAQLPERAVYDMTTDPLQLKQLAQQQGKGDVLHTRNLFGKLVRDRGFKAFGDETTVAVFEPLNVAGRK